MMKNNDKKTLNKKLIVFSSSLMVLALIAISRGIVSIDDVSEDSEIGTFLNTDSAKPKGAAYPGPDFFPSMYQAVIGDDPAVFHPDQTSTLEGTEIDGSLTVNAQGDFFPDQNALKLFDYFFLASGEVPNARIEATIKYYIGQHLSGQAEDDALLFFSQYLSYRQAAKAFYMAVGDKHILSERFELVKSLRVEIFGEALSEQLFAAQEKNAALTLERLEVLSDEKISYQQKEERVDSIIAKLPEAERESYQRSIRPAAMRKTIAALRVQRADSAQIWQAREQFYGAQAADRLAQLDEEKQQWQARMNDYNSQRANLLSNSSVTFNEKQQQLEQLQAELFSSVELKRVRALDDIAQQANVNL